MRFVNSYLFAERIKMIYGKEGYSWLYRQENIHMLVK